MHALNSPQTLPAPAAASVLQHRDSLCPVHNIETGHHYTYLCVTERLEATIIYYSCGSSCCTYHHFKHMGSELAGMALVCTQPCMVCTQWMIMVHSWSTTHLALYLPARHHWSTCLPGPRHHHHLAQVVVDLLHCVTPPHCNVRISHLYTSNCLCFAGTIAATLFKPSCTLQCEWAPYNIILYTIKILWSMPERRSRDEIPQAFSLCFFILEAIKNWRYRRPGNEAPVLQLRWQSS